MAFANIVVEVGLNGSAFERGVSKVISKAAAMNVAIGKSIGSIAGNQITQAFATAAIINKLQAGISETIAFGSSITDLSSKLGVSTDALQLWNFAATQSGASLGSVDSFFTKIASNRQVAVNGNLEMIAAFQKLGITIDEVKNSKPEDIALKIGKAFENGADPNALVGSLKAVGGRGADVLIAAFQKGLGATFDEGLSLKIVISADELAKIDALGDRLDVIQMQMRPVFYGIAIVMIKAAEMIYDSVRLATAATMDLVSKPSDLSAIKNPKLRAEVEARQYQNIIPSGNSQTNFQAYVKDKTVAEAIESMKSEKMGEIDALIKKKKSDIDTAKIKAKKLEVGRASDDTSLQDELAAIEVEFKNKKDILTKKLTELTVAFVEPFSAVDSLAQDKIDQANAELKTLEAAKAKQAPKPTTPLVPSPIDKKLRPVKDLELLPKITDSLAKVGGFTMGRDVVSLTVAKQQLAVLETIANNIECINKDEGGDGL